jgi:hypothetical protein
MKYRSAFHYLLGILAVFSAGLSPFFPLLLIGLFIVYELNQESWKRDRAYLDILECLVASSVTIGGLLIWRVISYG